MILTLPLVGSKRINRAFKTLKRPLLDLHGIADFHAEFDNRLCDRHLFAFVRFTQHATNFVLDPSVSAAQRRQ